MHSLSLLCVAALSALVSGNPLSGRAMTVQESVAAVPEGFAHAGPVSSTQDITLRISLAHTDIAGLEKRTFDVSDPASVLYGQHLAAEEIAEFVKPTDAVLSAVTAWLSEHGVAWKSASPAGDTLQITVPVSTANTMLAADFAEFTHIASGTKSVRTLSYSVPSALADSIQFIHPTVAFVPPLSSKRGVTAINLRRDFGPDSVQNKERAELSAEAVPASCATVVDPTCLEALYGFPTAPANNSALGNTVGVSGFSHQFANQADLQLFLTTLRPDLAGTTFSLVEIDGGANDQTAANAGDEADTDIEYAVGMAAGVPVTFFSVGIQNTDGIDGFIDIANSILTMPLDIRPTVLTTSYGFSENQVTRTLAAGMCNAYMQLAAAGISVLFASGDGGVSGFDSAACFVFVPTLPGGCPFVTSVGGSTGLPPQAAAPLSSGGFSNFFTTPAYQAADVAAYISSIGAKYAGLYNTSGRGFPDVAAQAENVEIAWMDDFFLASGTSVASPIFASMIALVNDRLIAAGKPVLGFLNPFLYSATGRAAFTDVTSGSNPGCNTNGFSASPGWDPVTGLGTPNFDALLAAVGL